MGCVEVSLLERGRAIMRLMTVKHLGKRMVWGCLLLSFHFAFFDFMNISAWIAWYLIGNAVEHIESMMVLEENRREYKTARICCYIMLVNAIASFFYQMRLFDLSRFSVLYSLVITCAEMTTMFWIHTALTACDVEKSKEHEMNRCVYCITGTVLYAGYLFSTAIHNNKTISILCVLGLIVLRLWMVGRIYTFCGSGLLEEEIARQVVSCVTDRQLLSDRESEQEEPLWKYCLEASLRMDSGKLANEMLAEYSCESGILINGGVMEGEKLKYKDLTFIYRMDVSALSGLSDVYIISKEYHWVYYEWDTTSHLSYFIQLGKTAY